MKPNVRLEPQAQQRRYDIDAIRVIAFAILIFYHIGMFYVAEWSWHLKSLYQAEWLTWPMLFVNQWRMALVFLVSGLALSFSMNKYKPSVFIARRAYRLGVPFLVAMVVIIPIQPYLELLSHPQLSEEYTSMSYVAFLWRYLHISTWPEGAFVGSTYGFTWNHLWFIPYLFCYTVVLGLIHPLLKKIKLQAYFEKTGFWGLLCIPILFQLFWKVTLDDSKLMTLALIGDTYAHGLYFSYFLFGYLIALRMSHWENLKAYRIRLLVFAAATCITLILFWKVFNHYTWQHYTHDVLVSINQCLWILTLLAWSYTKLNRPITWVNAINKRIYAWYIFHQSVILLLAYFLTKWMLGGILEACLLILMSVFACYLVVHRWGRGRVFKVLFGVE